MYGTFLYISSGSFFGSCLIWAMGGCGIEHKSEGRLIKILPDRQTHVGGFFGQPFWQKTFSKNAPQTNSVILTVNQLNYQTRLGHFRLMSSLYCFWDVFFTRLDTIMEPLGFYVWTHVQHISGLWFAKLVESNVHTRCIFSSCSAYVEFAAVLDIRKNISPHVYAQTPARHPMCTLIS